MKMDNQRIRNLTTCILHTQMEHIYRDIEALTGERGVMTHHLPNASKALEPFLRERLKDPRFWDGTFDPDHLGSTDVEPLRDTERVEFFAEFAKMPSALERLGSTAPDDTGA